jgi:hypothetical protein
MVSSSFFLLAGMGLVTLARNSNQIKVMAPYWDYILMALALLFIVNMLVEILIKCTKGIAILMFLQVCVLVVYYLRPKKELSLWDRLTGGQEHDPFEEMMNALVGNVGQALGAVKPLWDVLQPLLCHWLKR